MACNLDNIGIVSPIVLINLVLVSINKTLYSCLSIWLGEVNPAEAPETARVR